MPDFDVTKPDGGLPVSQGDDDIRTNNNALVERLEKEHQFPDNPLTARSGRHKFGVGSTAARDLAIPAPWAGAVWFNTDSNAWQTYDGTVWRGATGTVDPLNVDDISQNDAFMDTMTSPGTYAARSPATDLIGELRRLRYVASQIAIGHGTLRNGAANTVGWIEKPARPQFNRVINGRFSIWDMGASPATVIYGWTKFNNPATYTVIPKVTAAGMGFEASINADTTNKGFNQTVRGLRADTLYYLRVRGRRVSGLGTVRVTTTGGSGSVWGNAQLDITSPTDIDVTAVILTSSVPADIVISIVSVTNSCTFAISEVDLIPVLEDPMAAEDDAVYGGIKFSTGQQVIPNDGAWTVLTDLETDEIRIPGPGYEILVEANVIATASSGNDRQAGLRIEENIDAGGYAWNSNSTFSSILSRDSASAVTTPTHLYRLTNWPTDTTYRYRAVMLVPTGGVTWVAHPQNLGVGSLIDTVSSIRWSLRKRRG